jgi:hypothetical protein
MKVICHVNQHNIRKNAKTGSRLPVITTKTYKENKYVNGLEILDENGNVIGRIKYQPDDPLSCGARVWIEFYDEKYIREVS